MSDNGDIEEVLKNVSSHTKKKYNHLKDLRCYLAGPIDNAKDDGITWRKEITKWLKRKNVHVFDPCNKSVSHAKYKEVDEEKKKMMALKKSGRYFELSQRMKEIVHFDLRMTDISDFLIVYMDPKVPMFGTIHEFINSLHQRKPTLVVVEGGKQNAANWMFGIMDFNFIFDSFDELKTFLEHIDQGVIEADLSRWVFFDE